MSSWRANVTLWAMLASVVVFSLWRRIFDFPESTEIEVFFGLIRLTVSQVAYTITLASGWLSLTALLSLSNLHRILKEFFRPSILIDNEEMKEFFDTPLVLLVSLGLLVFVGDLASANQTVKIRSATEVVVALPAGRREFLVHGQNLREVVSLSETSGTHLTLRGRGHQEIFVVRDKYNLSTLEALRVTKRWFGVTIEQCALVGERRDSRATGTTVGACFLESPFQMYISGPYQFGSRKIPFPIVLRDGTRKEGGWLKVGELTTGPEIPRPAYARSFYRELFEYRKSLEDWSAKPFYDGKTGSSVGAVLERYRLDIRFSEASLVCGDRQSLGVTRETEEVTAYELF